MASVEFDHVGKVYGDGTRAVSDLSLTVPDGDFVVLVGPSGCGKTTALRMVAGLEVISEGDVRVGSQTLTHLPPQKRDIAMVFQNYALYPHMDVFDNIAFPLRSRRIPRNEIRERVEATAALLGLTEHLRRRPRTLSGGQRQRVAMGRALVRRPNVFLMDEPLSNLDAKLRAQMRAEIASLQRDIGVTTLYVTHDQVEALTMGTRIAVMRKGILQQYGSPQEVYDRPKNLFVATFIGSPAMNLFRATVVVRSDEGYDCVFGRQSQGLPLAEPGSGLAVRLEAYRGEAIAIGVRPEHVGEAGLRGPDALDLGGTVSFVEALGSDKLAHLRIDAEPVDTDEIREIAEDIDVDFKQSLSSDPQHHEVSIVGRFGARSRVAVGDVVRVAIEPTALYCFDLNTGQAIRA